MSHPAFATSLPKLKRDLAARSIRGGAARPKPRNRRPEPRRHVVFVRGLPGWVTETMIRDWIFGWDLVCDAVREPRHPMNQEHRSYAFVDAPCAAEAAAIARRLDGAPLFDPETGQTVKLFARRSDEPR